MPTLLRETDKYLSLIGHNSNTMSRAYLLTYRQTISTLIDKGVNTGVAIDQAESRDMSEEMYTHRRSVVSNFHQGLQSFWIGYNERCYHFIEKLLEMRQAGGHHRLLPWLERIYPDEEGQTKGIQAEANSSGCPAPIKSRRRVIEMEL